MFAVKVSRKVSCRAKGSIELTSPELAHLNVLASAAGTAARPPHTMAVIAAKRRKPEFILTPLMKIGMQLPGHAPTHTSKYVALTVRGRQFYKKNAWLGLPQVVGQAPPRVAIVPASR